MTPLLEVKNLSMAYGRKRAFQHVCLALGQGEHLALLGPSGCGKSTLLRILAGLAVPTEGTVWLAGHLASEPGRVLIPPHRREMAMVFQDLALWPNLTVLQNVTLGLAGSDLASHARGQRAVEALEACAIGDLARRRPDSLSGGQQQRVALARALAVRPQVLLLDEPFAGLDVTIKTRLYEQIRELCATFHLSLILVAHDPFEARALCHQAAVLEDGTIQESGALDALLANPESMTLGTFVEQLRDTGKGLGAGAKPAVSAESTNQ